MWDWQITPSITAINAVRVDHDQVSFSGTSIPLAGITPSAFNSVRIDAPSLNSGVVWKATDVDTFRITLARGVQLPTLISQGFQTVSQAPGGIDFFGQPNLLPSIVWNGEIDYDRSLPSIRSTLRTAVFLQRTDNVIAPPFDGLLTIAPPIAYRQAANVGYTTAAGFEIGIKGHSPSGWRWNLSYALAATTDHTSVNSNGKSSSTLYARSVPESVVVAGIGYSHERVEADLMARWQSSFLDVGGSASGQLMKISVDNYVTFNARLGYRIMDNVTLSVVARQFNAPHLITTAGAPIERQLIASAIARF